MAGAHVAGVRDGPWAWRRPGGTPAFECTLVHGKANGKLRSWHSNGKLEYEGEAKNGVRIGVWRTFLADGSPRKESTYRSDG